MNINSFVNEIESAGYDTTKGIVQEFEGNSFTYQQGFVSITCNGDWTFSFRGTIGLGQSLAEAVKDEKEKYDAFILTV